MCIRDRKKFGHRNVALADGKEERSEAGGEWFLELCFVIEKESRGIGVAGIDSPHEWGLAVVLASVHVRSGFEEDGEAIDFPHACGSVKRAFFSGEREIGVSSGSEEELDHFGIAVLASEGKRGDSVAVGFFRRSTGRDERADFGKVIRVRGLDQWRGGGGKAGEEEEEEEKSD